MRGGDRGKRSRWLRYDTISSQLVRPLSAYFPMRLATVKRQFPRLEYTCSTCPVAEYPLSPSWKVSKQGQSRPLPARSAPLHANLFVSEAYLLSSLSACPTLILYLMKSILKSGGKSQVILELTGCDSKNRIQWTGKNKTEVRILCKLS